MSGLITGNARAPLSERGNDLYETPPQAVRALWRVERHRWPAQVWPAIWEPACGPGSIVKTLRELGEYVVATDLVDYGCEDSQSGIDFLMETRAPVACGAIITNPPFKNAQEFVTKARELVPYTAMLFRLAFLESERRRAILDQGDLARVHVFRKRLPMMHRYGWEGNKTNSGMAFAWFVWERDHAGPTELHRIDWEAA